MKKEIKLCINCKNYCGVSGIHTCTRTLKKIDLVTGKSQIETYTCYYQRMCGYIDARLFNKCGKEGRFFQPIN